MLCCRFPKQVGFALVEPSGDFANANAGGKDAIGVRAEEWPLRVRMSA